MRLVRLTIISEVDNETIRDVKFNLNGPSFIVDKGEKESGNNIGKTTFAKIINLCLGSKTIVYLYKDSDSIPNTEIKTFLDEKKVYATLYVQSEEGSFHILRRDLFEKGSCYIDNSKMNAKSYNKELKKLFMPDCKEDKVSFRDVIPFFMRVDISAEKMLKFNDNFCENTKYKSIYDFLLGIEDGSGYFRIKESFDTLITENSKILKKYSLKKIDDLLPLIDKDDLEIIKLNNEMKSAEAIKDFDKDNENAVLLDEENTLSKKKNELELRVSIWQEKIKSEQKNLSVIDKESLRLLYDDGITFLKDLSVSFDEMVYFHDSMVHNRIDRYQSKLDECKNGLKVIKSELSEVRNKITSNMVEYKYGLNSNLNQRYEDVLALRDRKNKKEFDYKKYNENFIKIRDLEEKLKIIDNNRNYYSDVKDKINALFIKYESLIMKEKNGLSFSDTGFPISVKSGKKGSGDSKAVASCLAFALFAQYDYLKREMPRFLVQDMMENVDLKTLEPIIQTSRDTGYQLIIPILNDRLSQIGIKEGEEILTLSKSDKLFKI